MKRLLLALTVIVLLVCSSWAANTTVRTGNTLTAVFDGTTSLDFATDSKFNLPDGAYFDRVELKAAAANDTVSLRENTSSGAVTIYLKSINSDPQNMYLGKEFHKFYVVGSEATASATIILHIAE